jgi:hypothetical protein
MEKLNERLGVVTEMCYSHDIREAAALRRPHVLDIDAEKRIVRPVFYASASLCGVPWARYNIYSRYCDAII